MAGNFRALAGTAAGTCFLLLLCERLFFLFPCLPRLELFLVFFSLSGLLLSCEKGLRFFALYAGSRQSLLSMRGRFLSYSPFLKILFFLCLMSCLIGVA